MLKKQWELSNIEMSSCMMFRPVICHHVFALQSLRIQVICISASAGCWSDSRGSLASRTSCDCGRWRHTHWTHTHEPSQPLYSPLLSFCRKIQMMSLPMWLWHHRAPAEADRWFSFTSCCLRETQTEADLHPNFKNLPSVNQFSD